MSAAVRVVLVGCALVVAGVSFIHWPTALIVAGALLTAGGLLVDFEE